VRRGCAGAHVIASRGAIRNRSGNSRNNRTGDACRRSGNGGTISVTTFVTIAEGEARVVDVGTGFVLNAAVVISGTVTAAAKTAVMPAITLARLIAHLPHTPPASNTVQAQSTISILAFILIIAHRRHVGRCDGDTKRGRWKDNHRTIGVIDVDGGA